MNSPDWIVLIAYLLGTIFVGVYLGRLVKSAGDLFSAGGQSPWWASGLSGFMTMFSANTFVVWGGMAYQYGVVAIMVNLCYGVAALAAGFTVAGKWKRLGVKTPAEYVEKRFGKRALHFYTWSVMIFRIIGSAGALYAIARLSVALMSGENTAGAVGGMSSQLSLAILIFGAIVVFYTMIGGLWAVLMTDVLQFIILNLAVVFVVILMWTNSGGMGGFVDQAPDGFLNLTAGPNYTWLFLFGWVAIHYFMIGAEFAFVQRYLCVPSPKDARKSACLFGVLYLFSPFLWLLPPLLWRVQSPIPDGASPEAVLILKEEAYIRSCKSVLPLGMVGLMMAAMFSATASLISSQLNVFSSVLTNDIYRPLAKAVSEKKLLRMGRVFTAILGAVLIGVALLIPRLGGAEKVIISITELMVVPLLAPILWGLLSRRINVKALWVTAGICIPLGVFLRFGNVDWGGHVVGHWLSVNSQTVVGVVLPLIILLIFEMISKNESSGWRNFRAIEVERGDDAGEMKASRLPARVVGWYLLLSGVGLFALVFVNEKKTFLIGSFSTIVTILGVLILYFSKEKKTKFGNR